MKTNVDGQEQKVDIATEDHDCGVVVEVPRAFGHTEQCLSAYQ